MFHFKKRKFVKNSINENHFEKYIAEATNATCSTDLKNAYLYTVNTLKNTLADCDVTKSVVGLDDEGNPIFWDMEKKIMEFIFGIITSSSMFLVKSINPTKFFHIGEYVVSTFPPLFVIPFTRKF